MTTWEAKYLAAGLEMFMSTPKPRLDSTGARVVVPPVYVAGDDGFIEGDEIVLNPSAIGDFTPDVLPDFNMAIINPRPGGQKGVGWGFDWIRPAGKLSRRQARFGAKYMIDHTFGAIIDGKWDFIETRPVSWINGRWRDSWGHIRNDRYKGGNVHSQGWAPFGDSEHDKIQLLRSMALTVRYRYSLVLSTSDDCLAVRVAALPETLRFILRTRDLGNERRRAALTHLVRRHQRARKKRPETVRQHLRGEYRCTWAGMNAALLPSQYDVEHSIAGAATERLDDAGLLRWIGQPGQHVTA